MTAVNTLQHFAVIYKSFLVVDNLPKINFMDNCVQSLHPSIPINKEKINSMDKGLHSARETSHWSVLATGQCYLARFLCSSLW